MKKFRIIAIALIAVAGVFAFTQCEKDHSCRMKVNCHYSKNGMDADSVCPFTSITFDISKYTAGAVVIPEISTVVDTLTDAAGVFEYTLDHPALLIVNATKIDSIKDETGAVVNVKKYTGTTQVQVSEGELTEKDILLVETN